MKIRVCKSKRDHFEAPLPEENGVKVGAGYMRGLKRFSSLNSVYLLYVESSLLPQRLCFGHRIEGGSARSKTETGSPKISESGAMWFVICKDKVSIAKSDQNLI